MTTVPFRGAEYIIPPGAEGVANLVFDVPKHARGVRGGTLDGEEAEGGLGPRHSESLFEIKCKVEIKLAMGMGRYVCSRRPYFRSSFYLRHVKLCSKDIILEIPVEVVHPKAIPVIEPNQQVQHALNSYIPPYLVAQDPLNSTAPYQAVDYNPYYPAHPLSPASPLQMPYLDPVQNQVWIPPAFASPTIPMTYAPIGYSYQSPSPVQQDVFQQPQHLHPLQNYVPQPYPLLDRHYQPHLLLPPENGMYIPRPSSAGAVASASEVAPSMIPGLPLPVSLTSQPLLPLPEMNLSVVGKDIPAAAVSVPFEPEVGKGERASRVTRHMRMLSRNRSVSPQSHRYPLPIQPAVSMNAAFDSQEVSSIGATLGIPSVVQPKQQRSLPPPPPLSLDLGNIPTEVAGETVLHSPRPQLTPKHSFTRDPVLGAISRSERVEELEKMADEVGRKSQDLSGDLPKGAGELPIASEGIGALNKVEEGKTTEAEPNINKTLPGPPVPSGKNMLSPPASRARADAYFSSADTVLQETAPLPSDQTPPTPALVAILPARQIRAARNELKTENGLDALERRLLAEVGTRKLDARDQKPDLRSIVSPVDTNLTPVGISSSQSIPIPSSSKSPEPLHDSAISSLTLAGGLGGDESDGEIDGRTHKAGNSRGGSSDGREGLHQYMRGRTHAGTPTNILGAQWEKARERADDAERAKDKQGKTSGKKKDRSSTKSAAKGRVAAWLGGIDPDVPPQEQIIPPSPSVMRGPPSPFETSDDDRQGEPILSSQMDDPPIATNSNPPFTASQNGVAASPNPRSSGFIPISTLRKQDAEARPLVARDATVVQEARLVQDIWSNDKTPVIQAKAVPQFLRGATPTAAGPISSGKDRKVSSSSSKPLLDPTSKPLSYSAAARNVWKSSPDASRTSTPPTTPPRPIDLSRKTQSPGKVKAVFPPPKAPNTDVKYDIRSARGGRGGKVASVANFWSSAAGATDIDTNSNAPVQTATVQINSSSVPQSQPLRAEKRLFSAAVKSPALPLPPKSVSVGQNTGANLGSSSKAATQSQKRSDARNNLRETKFEPKGLPSTSNKKTASTTALVPSTGRLVGFHVNKASSKSTEVLVQKRPATAMATPFSLVTRKVAPSNSLSTPSSSDHKLQSLPVQTKGLKPVIKGTSDPAVVSSSHATPTLSSTASLARPTSEDGLKHQRPPKLSTTLLSSTTAKPSVAMSSQLPSDLPRAGAVSPSKPVDLAFGQARLRDLIKKYQGQGQKT